MRWSGSPSNFDVQNQLVFLFDNDAEGYNAYRRLQRLTLPKNMRGMILPELDAFRAFPARGPEGIGTADINRRAAAIECYLDVALAGYPPAKVVWTNYKREIDSYHGALEYKESYTKAFLNQTRETLSAGGYDVTKLRAVLDAIVGECTADAGAGGPGVAAADSPSVPSAVSNCPLAFVASLSLRLTS
jgi:hypothetical protein